MTEVTNQNRESFIFYRSFFEALIDMDKESQADCLMAIADYALNGIEPKMTPAVRMFFTLIKPQLDANKKKYENGCKGADFGKLGGRPRKNPKETPKKPQQNPKETPNDNDNDNVNDYITPFNNSNELYLSPYNGDEKCSCDCKKKSKFEINGKKFCGQHTRIELSKLGRLDLIPKSLGSIFNKNKILVSSSLSLLDLEDDDFPVHLYLEEYGDKVILDVQNWLIKNKLDKFIDKKFICRQFNNFANRQRQGG